MPMERSIMVVCPHTGVTHPECSCSHCLTEQVRRFRPVLLQGGRTSEIEPTRANGAAPAQVRAHESRRTAP
jgi:hypothetical protein